MNSSFVVIGIELNLKSPQITKQLINRLSKYPHCSVIVVCPEQKELEDNSDMEIILDTLQRLTPLHSGTKLKSGEIYIIYTHPSILVEIQNSICVLKKYQTNQTYTSICNDIHLQVIKEFKQNAILVLPKYQNNFQLILQNSITHLRSHLIFLNEDDSTPRHPRTYKNYKLLSLNEAEFFVAKFQSAEKTPYTSTSNNPRFKNFNKIVNLVENKKNIFFSQYKESTLERRLEKRIHLSNVSDSTAYYQLLKSSENELNLLKNDFLIRATMFFRDTEAFEFLQDITFPQLLEKKEIRIWVAATSSGEEVYSIAILLEHLKNKLKSESTYKIFATDIDSNILSIASKGVYKTSDLPNFNNINTADYFNIVNDKAVIKSEIRNNIIFSKHDLLSDPPFIKMDFVSCRNVLIYFKQDAQQQAIFNLQFALKIDGTLLLGNSESLGRFSDSFDVLQTKWKIFKKNRNANLSSSLFALPGRGKPNYKHEIKKDATASSNYQQNVNIDHINNDLIETFAPPCLFLSRDKIILYHTPNFSKFLKLSPNENVLNLKDAVNDNVLQLIEMGTNKLSKGSKQVVFENINILTRANTHILTTLKCTLKHGDLQDAPYYLISIHPPTLTNQEDQTTKTVYKDKSNTNFIEHISYLQDKYNRAANTSEALAEQLKTIRLNYIKFRNMLKQAPLPMVITNDEGIIEYANNFYCKLTEYKLEELINHKTSILQSGYHNPTFYSRLWLSIKNGEVWNGEILNKKKSGKLFWEKTSITPIKSESGSITNYLKISHEISKYKELEKNYQQSVNRNNDLINSLHNLLQNLNQNLLALSKKGGLSTPSDQYTSLLAISIQILTAIDEKITGTQDKNKETYSIEHYQSACLLTKSLLFPNTPSTLNIPDHDDWKLLHNDLKSLTNIYNFICFYLFKLTDTNIDIIDTLRHNKNNLHHTIKLKTTQCNKVIEAFSLVRNCSLSEILNYPVEIIGLYLACKTQPNFSIKLIPQKSENSLEIDICSIIEPSKNTLINNTIGKDYDFSKIRILVVEDDRDIQEFLNEVLRPTGAKLRIAENGNIAINMYKNYNPDIVLMDIRMPILDGIDASLQIKDFDKSARIIAQTAFDLPSDIRIKEDDIFSSVIHKPINPLVIYETISKLVNDL